MPDRMRKVVTVFDSGESLDAAAALADEWRAGVPHLQKVIQTAGI
jgi:hypothetical protein